jgi:predicted DNA-binding protein with PD1-like motif
MKTKLLNESVERIWALVFDIGDPVMANLERFAREQGLRGAHFSGIGAFQDVTLRYFDWESRQYEDIPVDEQVEVLTLTGNVASEGDEPKVHAHLIIGRRDGSTLGGHLKEAHVRPTLEVILTEEPEPLVRRHDAATGLALIDL